MNDETRHHGTPPTKDTLEALLTMNPLAGFVHELDARRTRQVFGAMQPDVTDSMWLVALHRFAGEAPLTYWDWEQVQLAQRLLHADADRTTKALEIWSDTFSSGLENLQLSSNVWNHEGGIYQTSGADVVRIMLEFHPEYLRRAEHVFGQLIAVYACLLRKGQPTSFKVDIKAVRVLLESKGFGELCRGYSDRIRNGIAHGEVELTTDNILYGGRHKYHVAVPDFLRLFDELWRTCNALALAVLLFVAERPNSHIPRSVGLMLATSTALHPGTRYIGSVESTWGEKRQLHVDLESKFSGLATQLHDCGRVALHLVRLVPKRYERVLFSVTNPGASVPSLVIVKARRLATLIRNDADWSRLEEVYESPPLVWGKQSSISRRFTSWRIILTTGIPMVVDEVRSNLRSQGFKLVGDMYEVRDVENISVGWRARVKVTAVLRDPSVAEDRELVRRIVVHAVKRCRRRPVTLKFGLHERSFLYRRPCTVVVSVYKQDGPLRWVRSNGWFGENLIAVGERKWGWWRPYVQVKRPNEVSKGVRLQYEIRIPDPSEGGAEVA